jgi:hypothetical protein
MSAPDSLAETEDLHLAELVAEIGERLRQGEPVRLEDYPRNAEILRDLLPTIKMMAELPTATRPPTDVSSLGDFRLRPGARHPRFAS